MAQLRRCRWSQISYGLAAFVLDENGGVQVWCRVNVAPVARRCNSWVPVTQRISMPCSVLKVRCGLGFCGG